MDGDNMGQVEVPERSLRKTLRYNPMEEDDLPMKPGGKISASSRNLSNQIDELDKVLQAHFERISAVLTPDLSDGMKRDGDNGGTLDTRSEVAQNIDGQAARVRTLIDRVSSFTDRVDI